MDYPNRIIKLGESDPAIMAAVRGRLRELQFDVAREGPFDEKVLGCVKLFQTRNVDQFGRNLLPDGKIGPLSWRVLFELSARPSRKPANELAKVALEIARSQLGVLEVPRNSNRGKEVEGYLRSVGLGGGHAWCAAFVYWCLREASTATGVANSCKRHGGVHAQWNHAREKGLATLGANAARQDPSRVLPGMVFVIDHGRGLGHTGFVTAVQGALLSTVEGNTDASRTREGGGVYALSRKVGEINAGYVLY